MRAGILSVLTINDLESGIHAGGSPSHEEIKKFMNEKLQTIKFKAP